MKKSDFYYDLPEELIAQTPLEPRDSSRLLVYNKSVDNIEHRLFSDITDYLTKGDLLVVNNTRVLPARLFGKREGLLGEIEVLLLKRIDYTNWEIIAKPAKKMKVGTRVIFSEELSCVVKEIGEQGIRIVAFEFSGIFETALEKVGNMPLPPYIKEKLQDSERYQTVYSKINGSSAAPTAGLHFTDSLLEKIKSMGVEIAQVLLHVGLGTFRPVKEDDIENHPMHSEFYEIDEHNAKIINCAVKEKRRIICVGTTSVRVIESVADKDGFVRAEKGNTQIFIYPPYRFKTVNALITNFHLPESTLLMLVSALISREKMMEIYNTAVNEKYRFFSFGDAMFLQ